MASWECAEWLNQNGAADDDEELERLKSLYPEDNKPLVYFFTHKDCAGHLPLWAESDDLSQRTKRMSKVAENPHRLQVLVDDNRGILTTGFFKNRGLMIRDPPLARISDVLRVHEWAYIHSVLMMIKKIESRVEQGLADAYQEFPPCTDAELSVNSWKAALAAAGTVISAVDEVANNQSKCFCVVRPPGHHLAPHGVSAKEDNREEQPQNGSLGFCLLNNVAIGAAYARYKYHDLPEKGIKRIAIIDFDVHHGNGTEACVRNVLPSMLSWSQGFDYENHMGRTAAPFNTAGMELQMSVKIPSFKPWLDESDADNIWFCSIHGYGDFYPFSGKNCNDHRPDIVNIEMKAGYGSVEFRHSMRTQAIASLHEFKPDIIFISAGFDAHQNDSLSILKLREDDYFWATQQLVDVANKYCHGRIVSVLEGGYTTLTGCLSPLSTCAAAHCRALIATTTVTHESFDQAHERDVHLARDRLERKQSHLQLTEDRIRSSRYRGFMQRRSTNKCDVSNLLSDTPTSESTENGNLIDSKRESDEEMDCSIKKQCPEDYWTSRTPSTAHVHDSI
eukprot:GHVL01035942.1.p1 GENE.GHVL01035942.1~~GHVL01035942.1.p1  ORF type:complete len:562 (-),score=98.71 GHVL01035942.1:414-2099(-)